MRCVTLLMAADSAFVDTVPTYYENEEDYKSSHLYKGFKEAGKYLFKLEADGYQTMFVPFELKKIYKRETLRELKTVYLKPVPKKNEMMLDLMMPGIDGFEVIRRLRSSEDTKDLPIIILSALNSEQDIAKGFQLGANDFINKPIIMEKLLNSVTTQINLQEAKRKLQG